MSDKKLKLSVWLNIGVSNCNQDDVFESEYTQSEWDALSDGDKNKYLDMIANDHASNYLDCGATIIEE